MTSGRFVRLPYAATTDANGLSNKKRSKLIKHGNNTIDNPTSSFILHVSPLSFHLDDAASRV
jgi:hypothetical protein